MLQRIAKASRTVVVPTAARAASGSAAPWVSQVRAHLSESDPELAKIIRAEQTRQRESLVLIASENYAPQAVLDALGSVMSNKYSEGYPGARYYGGNQHIDEAESLCQRRALEAFSCSPGEWGVNVQALSGSPANFAVYTALLNPYDRIMAMDLPSGGHLSHGYQIPGKKISATSKYFETLPYRLNPATGLIDYEKLEEMAELYRPKLIIAGASAYSRVIDWERISQLAKRIGAYFMVDMAHISGLVAAGETPSPFPFADVVTTTTHKSLRGPRGSMIFYRKGVRSVNPKTAKETLYDLDAKINAAVFPGLQGGPHNHTIAALATALHQVQSPEFREYTRAVVVNAQAFATSLKSRGINLVSDGTDNHLVLVNLRSQDIDGARVEAVCEAVGLTVNKNTVPGDKSAMVPSGIRMGTPALTTRGLTAEDFDQVAEFFVQAVAFTKKLHESLPPKSKVKDFKTALAECKDPELEALASTVQQFAQKFPDFPGQLA